MPLQSLLYYGIIILTSVKGETMKKIVVHRSLQVIKYIILLASIQPFPVSAATTFTRPYIGIDLGVRHMPYVNNHGGYVFAHNYNLVNIYVGAKMNNCLGVELGGEFSHKKQRNVKLLPGKDFGEFSLIDNEFSQLESSSQINGWNMNLVGYCPVENSAFQLIGMLGFASLHINATTMIGDDETGPQPPIILSFKSTKITPRISGGFCYLLNHHFNIRGLITYEGTRNFKYMRPKQNSPFIATAKNSFLYSVGLFYVF